MPADAATPPPRVLIADDEPDVRALLHEVCEARGFETMAVGDGSSAIEALRSWGPFDVIISDIQMPGADGFDVLDAALAASPQCRVVLVTGHGTPDDRERARAGGAAAFLLKSSSLHTIGEVLDGLAPVQDGVGKAGSEAPHRLDRRVSETGGFASQARPIYTAPVPQRVSVSLKGVDAVSVIEADTIEPAGAYLELRRADVVVARFRESEVQGWWLDATRRR